MHLRGRFFDPVSYLVFGRLAEDPIAAGELDEATRAKAQFAVSLLADALAPTNLLLTNPAALKRALTPAGGACSSAPAIALTTCATTRAATAT